jgi:plastocyanin
MADQSRTLGQIQGTIWAAPTHVGDTLSVAFTVNTTNVTDGTRLEYVVSGHEAASIPADKTIGYFLVENDRASFNVPLTAQTLNDIPKSLTITLNSVQGDIIASRQFSINTRFTAFNSEFRGSERSESVAGVDINQVFYLLGGDDVVSKSVWSFNNDVFIPGRGNDTIYGGGGTDSVVFGGNYSDFVVNRISQGRFDITSVMEGNDQLYDVERLVFADMAIAFDISAARGVTGVTGQAYRVYKAAFNREPDQGGLGYWIAQMDSGMNMAEVAARFIDSNEFRSIYGNNPSDAVFLTRVYQNVLGREPEPAGYSWWLNELRTNPEKTRAKVLADFSESAENKAGVSSLISAGVVFQPYTIKEYRVVSRAAEVNEGQTAVFDVSTVNVAAGTQLAYTITGVSASDITGGQLSGTVNVGSDGKATISIPIAADNLTEGRETLQVNLQGQSASVAINDTSVTFVGISDGGDSGGGGGGGGGG